MHVIVDGKRSKVFYFPQKKSYLKKFYPKFENRMRYFFGLRKYPGINFKFICDELEKLEIKAPKILEYGKYFVETEEVEGILLRKFLEQSIDEMILEKYADCVSKILNSGIYCGDFNFGNFIVDSHGELVAIDLEDYRKVKYFKRDSREALRRLKREIGEGKLYSSIERKILIADR